jgi:hypothetical protein
MGNEEFLISSYVFVGLTCTSLGFAAYLWLRRPAEQVFRALQRQQWQETLRRTFPFSITLIALSAFLSVSYVGCSGRTYEDIVSDPAYIITINERQISESLSAIVLAIILWAVVIFMCLLAIRREQVKLNGREKDESRSASR